MAARPTLLSKLLGLFGLATKANATTSESYSTTDPRLMAFFSNVSASGKAVNEDSAMRNSTGWSCRRILAETIGSIPWGMYAKDRSGNATPADDHWLSDVLIDSPNAEMSDVTFREAMVMNLTGDGNAYALKETAGARVTSLMPVESELIKPLQKGPGVHTPLAIADGAVFFRYNDRGKPVDLPREKVFHVMGFSRNGLWGLSPIAHMREAMGLALASEDFGNRFFSQGGMPSGTVSVPNWLTEDQREIARENLQQMLGGLGNAHKFALFEGGMKPEPWGALSLEDMQFLVLRKFSVLEICRFYRVPPHMVADLERATFSNIEHLSIEFVQYTLLPYFTRFEAAVKKWLLTPAERKRFMLKFNPAGLLRGDVKSRFEAYSSALQNGWMNRNEVRALEDQPRVPGLDAYTVQINMAPVDRLNDIVDSQIEGNAAPDPNATTDAAAGKAITVNVGHPVVKVRTPDVHIAAPDVHLGDSAVHLSQPAFWESPLAQEAFGLIKAHAQTVRAEADEARKAQAEILAETQRAREAAEAARREMLAEAERSRAEAERARLAAAKDNAALLERVTDAITMPRKAVFNDKGDPIGTVPVKSLH